ncbi:oxygenase MpaB family protein [Streptomyces sp. NPDC006879]|uniref:oxygenase MpaB family protein n=1 Tax=Streptomyces sp. NPDC006879 TaxID=3364767 RepID=UPI0036A1657E
MRGDCAQTTSPPQLPTDGLLWHLAGDVRALLILPPSFVLETAHPSVGAGVDDHSVFRSDPWGRAVRSVSSVQQWVYGGQEAAREGRRLRRLHRDIRGTDPRGRPYHALEAGTYAWVHNAGFPVYLHAVGYLWRPLDETQRHRLYAEWRLLGKVLGINERELPATLEDFWPYYARIRDEVLEPTVVARELLATDLPLSAPDRGPRWLRTALRLLWPVLRKPFLRLRAFVTVGYLPPDARAALGLEWTERQERRLRRLSTVLRYTVPLLPARLRWLPLARAARAARAPSRGRAV